MILDRPEHVGWVLVLALLTFALLALTSCAARPAGEAEAIRFLNAKGL